jgi:phage tail-like protein
MATAAQNEGGSAGAWTDPYPGFNFKLEIQGVTEGHFAECDGLGVKINVTSYREGGNSQVTHRIPGAIDYAGVTLRYGLTKSTELWEWLQKVVQGTVERRNVSLIVLERDGRTEGARWNLINAWPSQWQGARLDAAGSELAIETITLVFEGLERG